MKTAILALLILVTSCKEQEADIVFKWRLDHNSYRILETYVWYKGENITMYTDRESYEHHGCLSTSYCFVPLIDSAVIAKRHAQGMALINALRSADKLINELEK